MISLLNILKYSTREQLRSWHKILGFYPHDLSLYHRATTHLSAQEKDHDGNTVNNERLEFLGDALISSVMAEQLYHHYPNASEGFLTRTRSKIVCRQHLNTVCHEVGLDHMLHLSPRMKENAQNVYGNAVEALVGAIYIDRGYRATRKWVLDNIGQQQNDYLDIVATEEIDFKSRLLEYGQEHHKTIEFELYAHNYTAHTDNHTYTYQVVIDGEPSALGKGSNKRAAQQDAAKNALEGLK